MDATFRPLTYERELLEKLLEPEFPGRDELRRQLDFVAAKQIFEDGTLALECVPCQRAPVERRVPNEGECADVDGGSRERIHPRNPKSLIRLPRDSALFTPYGEAGVKWSVEERES